MLIEIGELKIHADKDYKDKVVETLEKAGFSLVLKCETFSDKQYIIAKLKGESK